jgi:hypothetical protein
MAQGLPAGSSFGGNVVALQQQLAMGNGSAGSTAYNPTMSDLGTMATLFRRHLTPTGSSFQCVWCELLVRLGHRVRAGTQQYLAALWWHIPTQWLHQIH